MHIYGVIMNYIEMLKRMMIIHHFEMRVDKLFAAGELKGTSHLAMGQEATAVGVGFALHDDDYVASNHRGHGHFMARGAEPRRIMAELFGKASGYSKGLGGTQHMADFSLGFLGMNGITGGMMPVAAGAAFSAKYRKSGQVALAFFGDGASNQGTFHETLNMATIWSLPLILFCENNCYAMSSSTRDMVGVQDIVHRACGYDISAEVVDGNDVLAVYNAVVDAREKAATGNGPVLIEAKTYRIGGHSRGDQCVYRTREEEAEWAERDPVTLFKKYLISINELTVEEYQQLLDEVTNIVNEAEQFARDGEFAQYYQANR
jgi:TPP-dependent pyruvate/acetoin dehydrogenase alpha subunit